MTDNEYNIFVFVVPAGDFPICNHTEFLDCLIGVECKFLIPVVYRSVPFCLSCWHILSVFTGCIACDMHGPLARYVKLWVAHVPGMPGTFSPWPTSKETASWRSRLASRRVRDTRAVMHVGIANPRWQGNFSQQSRRMRKPQFYVSGKRPMT